MTSRRWIGRSFPYLFAFLLLACPPGAPGARATETVADRIHDSLMRAHPRYTRQGLPKALAGCFDWENSTPEEPDVRFLAVAAPGRGGGRGTASVARLASNALDRCYRGRRRTEADCECQVIDRNGRNVIEPPEEFIRRFE